MQKGNSAITRRALFSPCRRYRYTLWREWPIEDLFAECSADTRAHQYLMVIGLNPSTADEVNDDPTIRRCIDFAKRWGFGALCMTNLFAFRATKPESMKREDDPFGRDNNHWVRYIALNAGMILAAWGKDGSHLRAGEQLRRELISSGLMLRALEINQDGSPKHPLYVAANTTPIPYP